MYTNDVYIPLRAKFVTVNASQFLDTSCTIMTILAYSQPVYLYNNGDVILWPLFSICLHVYTDTSIFCLLKLDPSPKLLC